jgi:hypothetical protein
MYEQSNLRASDADRDHVAVLLGEAFAKGRLTKSELDERLERAQAARYCSELQNVAQDLPSITSHPTAWPPRSPVSPLPPERLGYLLDQEISRRLAAGWHLETRHGWQVVMTYGQTASTGLHIAHGVITIFTCFLWAIVWIIHANGQTRRREVISIDAYGTVFCHPLPH